MKRKALILVAIMTCIWNAFSQAAFQDLDFENATIVQSGVGISAVKAFPGWQASFNGVPTSVVDYGGGSLGGAVISIVDLNPADGTIPIDGKYSAYLAGGGVAPNLYSVSLSQTAIVPAGTESIQLDVANEFGPPFTVTVGGTTIPMIPLATAVHYELWGGDIPAGMAGQDETLEITVPPGTVANQGMMDLDDIVFSPNSVTVTPEPSPFVLTAIGGILFALYRRFVKS